MTGVHIDANTTPVASLGPSRLCGLSSERMMPRTTTRNGIKSEVTKRGMAYNATSQNHYKEGKVSNTSYLSRPQNADKHEHRQAILLLGSIHDPHR